MNQDDGSKTEAQTSQQQDGAQQASAQQGGSPVTGGGGAQEGLTLKLLKLSAPVIGLNVLGVMTLAIDTIMCGRLANAEVAQTALGFSTQIVFLLMVAMMGLTIGSVATVARAYGAGRHDRVNHVLAQSTLLTILLGVGVALLGNLVAHPLLGLLGAKGEVQSEGTKFLRILLWATPFNYLAMLYGAVLRGVGNTRLAFLVSLGSNAINIGVNYVFILGRFGMPGLGVEGAAIGTALAQLFSMGVLAWWLARGKIANVKLRWPGLQVDRDLAKDLIKIGAPAALDFVILQASFLSVIGMLGRLEGVAVAAHGIGMRIQAVAFIPGLSISQAAAALIGQRLGAKDLPGARTTILATLKLCIIAMTAVTLVILPASHSILGLFGVPPGGRYEELALFWMRVLGYGMPIAGVHIAFVAMMQGAGITNLSLRINLVSSLVFQIPLSYILGFWTDLGVYGVWLGFPLGIALKALAASVVFAQNKWARTGL